MLQALNSTNHEMVTLICILRKRDYLTWVLPVNNEVKCKTSACNSSPPPLSWESGSPVWFINSEYEGKYKLCVGLTSRFAITKWFGAPFPFPQQIQGLQAQENLKKGMACYKISYLTGFSVLSCGVKAQTKHWQWESRAVQTGTAIVFGIWNRRYIQAGHFMVASAQ